MDIVLQRILDVIDSNSLNEKNVLKELDINTSFFSDWKKGRLKKPSYDKIAKIAKYLNVSIDFLINGITKDDIDSSCELSGDELELLHLYRKFESKEKYKILGMLEMKLMIDGECKKITSSSSRQTDKKNELTA